MTSTAPTRQTRLATVLLVLVTAIWGSTFFLIRDLLEHVPTTDFLSVRFSIAAVVMLLVFRRQTVALRSRDLRLGLALGAVYGVAQVLQTTGLETTDASVSGFITGTYVVLTPVLAAVILRERIGPPTWAAVALATVGLAILSLRGLSIGTGEAVTLASAVLHGDRGRRGGAVGANLGASPPHRNPSRHRDGSRAGLRGPLRGGFGRRDPDWSDAFWRGAGRGGHVPRGTRSTSGLRRQCPRGSPRRGAAPRRLINSWGRAASPRR